jgi:hypothetical protein
MITNVGDAPALASDPVIPGGSYVLDLWWPAVGTAAPLSNLTPMPGRLRRAFALALLVAVLASACSDDGGTTAGAETTTPPSTTSTAPTTTLPPGGRQPTTEDPLRVTFAGDSVMAELAPAMIQALEGTGETRGRFVLAPSLARGATDGLVWNRELDRHRPELVVVLVGVWEDSVVGEESYARPGFADSYRTEVVEPFVDLVTRDGAQVLWVGMAAVRDPDVTQRFAQLNAVYEAVADDRPDVDFIQGGQYLSAPEGGYAEVGTSPNGVPERLRRIDGLHLCPAGVVALGVPVLDEISKRWNVGATYGWQQGSWREPPQLHAPEECPPV